MWLKFVKLTTIKGKLMVGDKLSFLKLILERRYSFVNKKGPKQEKKIVSSC